MCDQGGEVVGGCPLCGSDALVLDTEDYLECSVCRTLTQRRPPVELGLEESEARYAHNFGARERRWLALIANADPPVRSVLDLGAGDGGFVGLAHAEGWTARGLEGSEAMVALARARGYPVELCDVDRWSTDATRYGVVRLWYALEHVRHPGRLLREAARSLHAGGLLAIAVPNDANWLSKQVMRSPQDRFWEHPLHLHHFPPFGLEGWLRGLGFEVVIAEAGRPTELMRGGNLPLHETWEAAREHDPSLSRLFYQLGVGRSREFLLRVGAGHRS